MRIKGIYTSSVTRTLLVLAVGLVLATRDASANDVNNNITPAMGDTTFFGAIHTDDFDFTDVFTFSLAGPVSVNASLITIGSGLQNIDFISADLNGNALTLTADGTGFLETGSTGGDLDLTGPLVLTVTGKSGAAGGTFASYSGTMNVTQIPEPGTCSLILVGLGMVSLFSRRRKAF